MLFLLLTLLGAGALRGQVAPSAPPPSYLYEPAYAIDNVLRGEARPYVPQPGDILLATDSNFFWKITHDLALAFEPHNSAVVVALPDGGLGVLEAGPDDCLFVRINPLLPHLKHYSEKGPVWIRKRKTPLTPEQSAALTAFAGPQRPCPGYPSPTRAPAVHRSGRDGAASWLVATPAAWIPARDSG